LFLNKKGVVATKIKIYVLPLQKNQTSIFKCTVSFMTAVLTKKKKLKAAAELYRLEYFMRHQAIQ